MKALAYLCVAVLAGATVPASAGFHMNAAPHGVGFGHRGPGGHGPGLYAVDHGRFGGGERRHSHFFGAGWFPGGDDWGGPQTIEPAPDAPRHFYGASWIVPGTGSPVSRPADPAPEAAVSASAGPHIIYLNGKSAKTGKLPIVVYGTYK